MSTSASTSPVAVLALVLGAAAAPGAAQDPPPLPFLDLSVQDAAARAEREQRLVVLYFHKPVEASCRRMLSQTWPDEHVRKWVEENAVAVRIGDDDLRAIGRFNVGNWPMTLFCQSDLKVIHRMGGFLEPADFLVEANTAILGTGQVEKPEGEAAQNPMAWLAWGNWLFANAPDRTADILEAYLWCLDEGEEHQPGFRERHFEFLCERIAFLKAHTSQAVDALTSRRNAKRSELLAGVGGPRDALELVRFNFWLRDELDNLAVFDDLAAHEGEQHRALSAEILRLDLQRIVAWRRYDEVLRLVPDPLTVVASRFRELEEHSEGTLPVQERARVVDDAVDYYETLLAKGRGADARKMLELVAGKVPTGRVYCSFMERSSRLELYELSVKTAEMGLAAVSGKGRGLIESQLLRVPDEFKTAMESGGDDGGDGDR